MSTQFRLKKLEAETTDVGSIKQLTDDLLELLLIRNLRDLSELVSAGDPDYELMLSNLEWTESNIRYWAELNSQPDLEDGIDSVMNRQTILASWREPLIGKCIPGAIPYGSPLFISENELASLLGCSDQQVGLYDKMDDEHLTEALKDLFAKSQSLNLRMRGD